MKNQLFILFAFAGLLFSSCSSENKQANTQNTPPVEQTSGQSSVPAGTYTVNIQSSNLEWAGAKKVVDTRHTGTLALSSGSFSVQNGAITGGEFVVDINSITNTDLKGTPEADKLVGHLKSADFFDVAQYPNATFTITSVTPLSNDPNYNYTASGNLTMKGVTKPLTFPFQFSVNGTEAKVTSKFSINRTEYDIQYGSESFFKNLGDKVIKDEIELTLNLLATNQPAS